MTVEKISGINTNIQANNSRKVSDKAVPDLPQQEQGRQAFASDVISSQEDVTQKNSLLALLYPGSSSVTPDLGKKAYTLKSFKEDGGRLLEGKAYRSDAKPYTGTIFHSSDDGGRFAMEYEDGFLLTVDKFDKNNVLVAERNYSYDREGSLTNVSSILENGDKREVSINKKGIIIRKNDKIVKTLYIDTKKDLKRVSSFDDSGKLMLITCSGPGTDYPVKKYSYYGDTKTIKSVEFYTEDGTLRKLVECEMNGASKTILCPGTKNEQIIRRVRVATDDSPLPYGADKMLVSGVEDDACSIVYSKDGKDIFVEKYSARQRVDTYGDYQHSGVRAEMGPKYRKVSIEDKSTGEIRRELHYDSGAKDILLDGDFGASDMEVEFRDADDKVTGYFKRTFLNTVAFYSNSQGNIVTDRVREEFLDASGDITSRVETNRTRAIMN